MTIIIDKVDECGRLLSHMVFNDLADSGSSPLKQDVGRRSVHFGSKARTELAYARCCSSARGDQCKQVGSKPVRLSAVTAHHFDNWFVHLSSIKQLHRWDLKAIVEDGLSIDAH